MTAAVCIMCRCANKFGQQAPAGAPPVSSNPTPSSHVGRDSKSDSRLKKNSLQADLFNIWRDDYMLTPQQAAQEVSSLIFRRRLLSS